VPNTEELAREVLERGMTVAVAESLTSGMVANTVGAATRASDWFAGGVVAYTVATKERVLGLEPGTDPCSAQCAVQLAVGVRELLGADVAVSTTGVGGPEPEGPHDPGTVYLGWATADDSGDHLIRLEGSPVEVIEQATGYAVRLLTRLARGEDPHAL
jgi:nicotinamide-nucleotide amidase